MELLPQRIRASAQLVQAVLANSNCDCERCTELRHWLKVNALDTATTNTIVACAPPRS